MKPKSLILVGICVCFIVWLASYSSALGRTVIDSRGEPVELPDKINRVVTIDDGLIEGVMISLGLQNKLVGVGSRTFREVDNYTYPSAKGEDFSYLGGMNTASYLFPQIKELPLVAEYEAGVNFETLASLDPDVVLINLGSCTFWTNDENVQKAVKQIESLGMPVIILYGTDFYEQPNITTLWDEIRIIGEVFEKKSETSELVNYLKSQIDLIDQRTNNVTDGSKPRVLYFGLSPLARDEGSAGNTVSLKSFESWIIENIVHAKNAFREDSGYWHKINAEQVLAMNPDVIVLPTDWGYHPARELAEAPYYRNLQELGSIKNGRVASLPWTPYDCAKRLELPIEVMIIAKTAYPDRFKKISLGDWVLDFYQNVYHIDKKTAEGLRSIQWIDWTADN